jgi:hypothetical protein
MLKNTLSHPPPPGRPMSFGEKMKRWKICKKNGKDRGKKEERGRLEKKNVG